MLLPQKACCIFFPSSGPGLLQRGLPVQQRQGPGAHPGEEGGIPAADRPGGPGAQVKNAHQGGGKHSVLSSHAEKCTFFHFRLSLLSSRTFSTTILRRRMGSWSVVTLASRTSKSSFVLSYFIAFVSPPVPEKNICEHLFIKVKKRLSQLVKGWLFKCLGSAFFSIDSGKYLKSDVFRQLFCNILRIPGRFFFAWMADCPTSPSSPSIPPYPFFAVFYVRSKGGGVGIDLPELRKVSLEESQ